jgi:hypothetical protein
MSTLYELVEWEHLGFNLPRSLPYGTTKTIAEAVSNIRSAGTFVVAVENGVRRSLTTAESGATCALVGECQAHIYRFCSFTSSTCISRSRISRRVCAASSSNESRFKVW